MVGQEYEIKASSLNVSICRLKTMLSSAKPVAGVSREASSPSLVASRKIFKS